MFNFWISLNLNPINPMSQVLAAAEAEVEQTRAFELQFGLKPTTAQLAARAAATPGAAAAAGPAAAAGGAAGGAGGGGDAGMGSVTGGSQGTSGRLWDLLPDRTWAELLSGL